MKIGVAPIIDPDAPVPANDPEGVVIIGAVVVAYAQTAKPGAARQAAARHRDRVLRRHARRRDELHASGGSHRRRHRQGQGAHRPREVRQVVSPTSGQAEGRRSTASTTSPRRSRCRARPRTRARMPKDYPAVDRAGDGAVADRRRGEHGRHDQAVHHPARPRRARRSRCVGLYLSHRRLIAQVDQIELGVTDIINGNVDRTFRPVGPELDGLANGLNVMLARLLGRPEPGEEEFDEEGNPIIPGRVEFEEARGEQVPQTDPELARARAGVGARLLQARVHRVRRGAQGRRLAR